MTYICSECGKEVKQVRYDLKETPKVQKCNECYFNHQKEDYGRDKT